MAKDDFFTKMNQLGLALTFDDVRLRTGHSEVLPDEVSVESKFSRNVPLKIPIVSAAMDTVTEVGLAVELAKLGGLGVIHRSLSIKDQARQVGRVKYHLNGLIDKPITVNQNDTLEFIQKLRQDKGYDFWSFPVVDDQTHLVGLLTRSDFELRDNPALPAKQAMTTDLVTVGSDIDREDVYKVMQRHKKKIIPVVDSDRCVLGLYVFSDLKRLRSPQGAQQNIDSNGQLRVAAAVGADKTTLDRVQELQRKHVDAVVIDTAHADTSSVIETLSALKTAWPKLDVVVGNISEAGAARRLIEAGADGIKVGQGPGSSCTTRVIAGIGTPQVTAIYRCALADEGSGVPVCADGGLRFSGDIPIAIGAGAHSVMLGSMLAGVEETPGEKIFLDGRQWKTYRGMGSVAAMAESQASRERYGQASSGKSSLIPEGIEGLVPYKGVLKDVIHQYIGGLRRGMGYVGAANIQELREKADFIRITAAGQHESHPHDIKISKEAPNYQR